MKQERFHIDGDISIWLKRATRFANSYSYFSLFQSNDIPYPHGAFPTMLAIGAKEIFHNSEQSFEGLKELHNNEWLFGFFGYDLKNQIEELESHHSNHTRFEELVFFKPEILIEIQENAISVKADHPEWVFNQIGNTCFESSIESGFGAIQTKLNRGEYLKVVQRLRQHIEEGDIYEINFCQEFFGEIESVDPVESYWALNTASPKPFSAFQKFDDQYLLCASPERFIKKEGQQLISQPIKGTIRRGLTFEEDEMLKHRLRHDEKELAENMMIVDLVRNDLAKSSKTGSVNVEEIFGIYSFKQVHQMISTVTSELEDDVHFIDAIRNAFPMGSMTGAPKIKVMELIEKYEKSKRGIFSGAAGYITPEGDFDFNVVIRSLFLNMSDMQYSFQVGSAITYDSVPETEYEECLLKASAIISLLEALPVSNS